MTARAAKDGGDASPFQVQAQYLRDYKLQAATGPISGFAILLEGEALNLDVCALQGEPRLEEIKYAIGAAEEAGLRSYRIEIAPDGTIALVVGMQTEVDAEDGSTAA